MIQTVTIDIMNEKAIKHLQDLEHLQLIRLRKDEIIPLIKKNINYKGAMKKQNLEEVDDQLEKLRNGKE